LGQKEERRSEGGEKKGRKLTSSNDSFQADHLSKLSTSQGSRVDVVLSETSSKTDVD